MVKKIIFILTIVSLALGTVNFDARAAQTRMALEMTSSGLTSPDQATGTGSNTTTTSGSGGWAAPDCTATKPSTAPVILTVVKGKNSVTLNWSKAGDPVTNYLVAYGTKSGSITYGNPSVGNVTSYTVGSLSGGTKYYFKVKAINDCMPGDYSNEVSSTPEGKVVTGGTAAGFVPITEIATSVEPTEAKNPLQLFDIALIVDQPKVNKVSDLKARVTFISFGSQDTPVKMHFKIIDGVGNEYYNSDENMMVQTEGVFNKSFEGINLADGKYVLVLTTLYNTNIRDEFKQNIEIFSSQTIVKRSFWLTVWENRYLFFWGLILLGVFGLIFFLLKRRKRRKNR